MRGWSRCLGALSVLALTALLASPVRAAHADNLDFTGQIVNKYSVKCVDRPGGTEQAGAEVQQYHCNGTSSQRWEVTQAYRPPAGTYQLRVSQSAIAMCLEDEFSNPSYGAPVSLTYCQGDAPSQQWRLLGSVAYGWYMIQNVLNPRCLDMQFDTHDGKHLVLADCGVLNHQGGGSWDQQFQFQFQFGQYG